MCMYVRMHVHTYICTYILECVHKHTHVRTYVQYLPEEKGLVGSVLNAVHCSDGDPDWVAVVRSIPRRSFRDDDCFFVEAF